MCISAQYTVPYFIVIIHKLNSLKQTKKELEKDRLQKTSGKMTSAVDATLNPIKTQYFKFSW